MNIGIDVIEVERIRRALDKWGARFREKVFTQSEMSYCESKAAPAIHYAARFAAKEAVAKALKSSDDIFLRWRDVEIVSADGGVPSVRLHGEAAERFGAPNITVSLSHSRETAVAVALLEN